MTVFLSVACLKSRACCLVGIFILLIVEIVLNSLLWSTTLQLTRLPLPADDDKTAVQTTKNGGIKYNMLFLLVNCTAIGWLEYKVTIDLAKIASTGESVSVEFKEKFTDTIGKTICAFSNTFGGKVYLGIADPKTDKGQGRGGYSHLFQLWYDN